MRSIKDFYVLLQLVIICNVCESCNRGGSNGAHELSVRASQNAELAYRNLQTYLQGELFVVNNRISELQHTFVKVIAPQTERIANGVEVMANTTREVAMRLYKTLDQVDVVLHEVQGGLRLIFVILLLLGTVICQFILERMGNVLNPSIRFYIVKGIFYAIQIFCCLCAFGILVDFLILYVLRLREDAFPPGIRIMLTYVAPIIGLFSYHLIRFLWSVMTYLVNFLKFLLHGPYLVLLAPYVILYQVYVYRGYHRNKIGVYIVMFSFYAIPVFVLIFWQLLTGLRIRSLNDIWHIDFDERVLYSVILTHIVYCLEALLLRKTCPIPNMAMINRPHHERRYYLKPRHMAQQ